ncbi:MAG TPA: choice-of-anchor E domain-containing protein [Chthoniobacterales bacterium]|jgi:hypothetical protein
MKSIVTLSVAILLSAITLASAATVTYTSGTLNLNLTAQAISPAISVLGTYSNSDTESVNFTLQQFDSSLGTLQSVQFVTDFAGSMTSATFDVSPTVPLVSANLITAVSLDRSLSLSVNNAAFTNPVGMGTANASGTVLASVLGVNLSGNTGTDGSLTGSSRNAVQGYTTSSFGTISQLNAVSGLGTYSLTLSGTDLYSFTATATAGTTTWGGTTGYSGTVSVIYTYAAVPEPGTTTLLVSAGLGLLVLLRRRHVAI